MGNKFSETLSDLRKRCGLSQRRAAADLKISQALLSHYENGAREPGLGFVCRACDYYGVSADFMLGRIDEVKDDGKESIVAILGDLHALLRKKESGELYTAASRYITACARSAYAHVSGESSLESLLELKNIMAQAELELFQLADKLDRSGEMYDATRSHS